MAISSSGSTGTDPQFVEKMRDIVGQECVSSVAMSRKIIP